MTRNTDLYTGCIREVDDVINEAVRLRPFGLTTGACVVVTLLRAHDAAIAGG